MTDLHALRQLMIENDIEEGAIVDIDTKVERYRALIDRASEMLLSSLRQYKIVADHADTNDIDYIVEDLISELQELTR
jgi:hypothetical protein